MKPEDIVSLKKHYNVNTDVELIEAQEAHIRQLQEKLVASKEPPHPPVRERVRKA